MVYFDPKNKKHSIKMREERKGREKWTIDRIQEKLEGTVIIKLKE